MDELSPGKGDEACTSLTYLESMTGSLVTFLFTGFTNCRLENAGETETVGHGEDEEGGRLVLDELPDHEKLANADGKRWWCYAKGIFEGFNGSNMMGSGANTADTGDNDGHLLSRCPLQKIAKTAQFGSAKMGGEDQGHIHQLIAFQPGIALSKETSHPAQPDSCKTANCCIV